MSRVEVSVEISYQGLGDATIRSDEVAADIEARAGRVKEAVDARGILVQWPGQPRIPIPCEVRVDHDEDRTRAHVGLMHPAGIRTETKYHVLTSSVDAAAR